MRDWQQYQEFVTELNGKAGDAIICELTGLYQCGMLLCLKYKMLNADELAHRCAQSARRAHMVSVLLLWSVAAKRCDDKRKAVVYFL